MLARDPLRVLLVALTIAIVTNSLHLASVMYDVPNFLAVIILPAVTGVIISRVAKHARTSLLALMGYVLLLSMLMYCTLILPAFAGVFEDVSHANYFSWTVALRVFHNIFVVTIFALITNLAGLLFWGTK